jgi:phosphotransferase system HPr-like phosphotransfer protein
MSGNAGPEVGREFELRWRMGIRTCWLIVRVAGHYTADLRMTCRGIEVDPKDVLGLLALSRLDDLERDESAAPAAPPIPGDPGTDLGLPAGTRIGLRASGADAAEALAALDELLTCGPRFESCVRPDCPSSPLLVGYTDERIFYACSHDHEWDIERR